MAIRDRITVVLKDGTRFQVEATRAGGDVKVTFPTTERGRPQMVKVQELSQSPSKPPIQELTVTESEVAVLLEERDRPLEPKTSAAAGAKRSRKPKGEPVEA